ncbi:hypothetical protein V6Z11_A03G113000 [Gossypium hirsutum]
MENIKLKEKENRRLRSENWRKCIISPFCCIVRFDELDFGSLVAHHILKLEKVNIMFWCKNGMYIGF